MGFFNKQRTDGRTYDGQGEERKGFIDRISFNGEAEDIVWKFPYDNLSIGTQLIVNHSQEAIFLRGGAVCDIFGEGTHTLSTNNIPVLQKLIIYPLEAELLLQQKSISSAKPYVVISNSEQSTLFLYATRFTVSPFPYELSVNTVSESWTLQCY